MVVFNGVDFLWFMSYMEDEGVRRQWWRDIPLCKLVHWNKWVGFDGGKVMLKTGCLAVSMIWCLQVCFSMCEGRNQNEGFSVELIGNKFWLAAKVTCNGSRRKFYDLCMVRKTKVKKKTRLSTKPVSSVPYFLFSIIFSLLSIF